MEHAVVYKKPGIYAAFPDLFEAEDGTLVIRFVTRASASHYDSTGGWKVLHSEDGGSTWREPDRARLNPAFKTTDGRYVIPACNSWSKASADEVEELRSKGIEVRKVDGAYFYAIGAHVRTTADEGETWTRVELNLPPHALMMGYNDSGYLRSSENVRLLALYGKLRVGERDRVFLLRSTDDARTWQFRPMLGRDQEEGVGFNETALVETADGAILAFMRPDPDSIGYLFSSLSVDGGVTWTKPQKTSIRGYPADLLTLGDGRIFSVYGYRKSPMGIRAGILGDDYRSIDGGEMVLRDDAVGSAANVGYPVAVQTGDETVLVAYYITTSDGVTHVATTTVHL